MGNPNPKIENLRQFKIGRKKTGGRQKGVPNKITAQVIIDGLSDKLNEINIVTDEEGFESEKTTLELVLDTLAIKAMLGDSKAIEMIFKCFGLPINKIEVSGNVDTDDKNTAQIVTELCKIANAVGKRTDTPTDESTQI